MTAPYTRDAKFSHQKIIEAVSPLHMYPGILTKKQARCTVTWHGNYTECSDKFQAENKRKINGSPCRFIPRILGKIKWKL
jgi:hypothetical protein